MNLQTSAICILILVVVCIQVYVCGSCVDGWYGDHCQHKCPGKCFSCLNTSQCGPCLLGAYGLTCTNACSIGCNAVACGKWDGKCSSGCQNGYFGEYCCLPGKDGDGCTITGCPEHCTACLSNGTCTSCDDGYYGTTCSHTCLVTCANTACNKDTGMCDTCPGGLYGSNCDMLCPDQCLSDGCLINGTCQSCNVPYYGDACESMCFDRCDSLGCDKHTGTCKSCLVGFSGDICSDHCSPNCKVCLQNDPNQCTECADGKYGVGGGVLKCNVDCSSYCKDRVCAKHNGNCINGCQYGFTGDTCSGNCPPMCKGATCFQSNGTCDTGCESGFSGLKCTCQTVCTNCSVELRMCFKCEEKHFLDGQKCSKCPEMCLTGTCKDLGECTRGCVSGFYGTTCDFRCDKHCEGGTCDDVAGKCLNGCADGYVFDGNVCKAENGHASLEQSPVAVIAGGVAGGLVFLAVVITAVVWFIRNGTGRSKEAAPVDTHGIIAGVTSGEFNGQAVQSQATDGTSAGEGNTYDVLNLDRTEGSSAYTAIVMTSTSTAGNYVNLQGENNPFDPGYAPPTNTDYQNLNV